MTASGRRAATRSARRCTIRPDGRARRHPQAARQPVGKFTLDFEVAESTPLARHGLGTADAVDAVVYERAGLRRRVTAEVRVVDDDSLRLETSATTRGIPCRAVVVG